METETYKKAKEILERFDPEKHKQLQVRISTLQPCSHWLRQVNDALPSEYSDHSFGRRCNAQLIQAYIFYQARLVG